MKPHRLPLRSQLSAAAFNLLRLARTTVIRLCISSIVVLSLSATVAHAQVSVTGGGPGGGPYTTL